MKLKNYFGLLALLVFAKTGAGQLRLPAYPDSLFGTYYQQRVTHFRTLPFTKNDVIFLGNSITDGGEWSELFDDVHIKNRGISGDVTAGVIGRLDEITARRPKRVFLLIGVNDLARNVTPDSIEKNIRLITDWLHQESPATQVFVQSILPVNAIYGKFATHTNKGEQIRQLNASLQKKAGAGHYTFIDLYSSFCAASGKLNARLTNDGLHLKGEGYLLWKHLVYPYVYGLQARPSLIPMPQQLRWQKGFFPLYACREIYFADTSLRSEAAYLLRSKGLGIARPMTTHAAGPFIELRLGKVVAPQFAEEAYRIDVTAESVLITANTRHGICNGLQTLVQMMRDQVLLDACVITDWPAFSWRGYMVDVGRNYQSPELLKQQIDMMAKYKLNVFHFHCTEDIAWRLAIGQYPALTAPENMTRWKGLFYTEEEIKDLIRYCRERYIEFVPEIDMPGHSAAFRRAMKTDMQSDTGLQIVRNIIREVCSTYDINYLHLGADEVKIKNKDFLPEVIGYVESLGKKAIGWQPGGNFSTSTIRQLWGDDAGDLLKQSVIPYIDSRQLYLNHMDPLESVTTIFKRQIDGKEKGDAAALGGTICLWPDRAVARQEDVLVMSAAYPSMLAFAERIWRGGGEPGWTTVIGEPGSVAAKTFAEFENRLIDHRTQYFQTLPFPYQRQSDITWKLYGPYNNKGDLSTAFAPENPGFEDGKPAVQTVGGTIVLRHWWAPVIKGVLDDPEENSTWYAATRIWSDEDGMQDFWIGFNDLSRSPATDPPKAGTWNSRPAAIWINGELIPPPSWKHAGQKGNAEMPLTDEGYTYRPPTLVRLHRGWNTVMIKNPVGSFRGDWQNPVKWMFTMVRAEEER